MHMDRAIFDLNAGVEATSLYILLCALLDQGQPLTLKRAEVQWNGTREGLFGAAEELMQRGVLDSALPLAEETPLQVNSKDKWKSS